MFNRKRVALFSITGKIALDFDKISSIAKNGQASRIWEGDEEPGVATSKFEKCLWFSCIILIFKNIFYLPFHWTEIYSDCGGWESTTKW